MAQVRYIVDDVDDAVAFYVSKLGFELERQYGTEKEVGETFREMASIVDEQNAHDESYSPMTDNYAGDEFRAALEIVSNGLDLPNGYTESVLRAHRLAVKEARNS